MADEIFYKGPAKEYTPSDGANRETFRDSATGPISTGYADMDYLLRLLTMIRSEVRANIYILEAELNQLVLVVKDTPEDDQLRETLYEEWPASQGAVKNFVPYPYYKALETRDTAAATYIRKRWESAARDIGGPVAFDLIKPLYVIRNEVELVVDFIARYIGTVDDSSEERIVELLQEWAAVALAAVRNIGNIYSAKDSTQGFSQSELDSLSASESAQYQAIFKVKVNEANINLEQNLTSLTKSYATHSAAFYSRVMGPALQFRLNASRKIYPASTTIAKVANQAAESLNMNLSLIITDMIRRNNTFTEKINAINDAISLRDRYRWFVVQLAVNGKNAVSPAIAKTDTPLNPDEWFDQIVQSATPTTYRPSHSKLVDTELVDAHPQYLDRFGRNPIEADIEVNPGVKVGGVLLSGVHDGTENSPRINGRAIDGLVADVIDREVYIEPPSGLRLVKTQSGSKGVDAHIVWDADRTHLFDVQITPVDSDVATAFQMVYPGDPTFLGYQTSFQTIEGDTFYRYIVGPGGFYAQEVKDGVSPVLLFDGEDILITGGHPVTEESLEQVGLGLSQDWEMSTQGDIYFAVPSSVDPDTGDPVVDAVVVKYTRETNTLAAAPFVPGEMHPDYTHKVYASLTYDPSREKLYLSGGVVGEDGFSSEEDTPYATFLEVVNPGSTTSTRVGDYQPFGPLTYMASDYGADGYIYGFGIISFEGGSTPVFGISKTNTVTGVSEILDFDGGELLNLEEVGELLFLFGVGMVATESELLFTFGFRHFAVSFTGGEVRDLTNTLPFNYPHGICKDKYGRVYIGSQPGGQIYRVYGPEGAAVFS